MNDGYIEWDNVIAATALGAVMGGTIGAYNKYTKFGLKPWETEPTISSSNKPKLTQRLRAIWGNQKPGAYNPADVNWEHLKPYEQEILSQLSESGMKTTINANGVSKDSIAGLTAATGDEFALFSKGGEYYIVRGNPGSVSAETVRNLISDGWFFEAHTHPFNVGDDISNIFYRTDTTSGLLKPSTGDLYTMIQANQTQSVIYNPLGESAIINLKDHTQTLIDAGGAYKRAYEEAILKGLI